jgi:hypothetical protein
VKISDQEQRNVWLSFAAAVISSDPDASRCSLKDVVEDASDLADAMLDEYLSRFGEGEAEEEPPQPRRRIKQR